MIDKISLLINTVKYLKPTQIFHQIFYRLKASKNLSFYFDKRSDLIGANFLLFDGSIFPEVNVQKHNSFEFLNLEKIFTKDINWDFQDFGKLWNYNLQYFNYLNNSNLPTAIKLNWLLDIGSNLNNGKLKLEPYPVSLRIINTIRFFSREEIIDQQLISQLKGQVKYLEEHLEFHLLGNHLLENAFALIMSGYFFENEGWKRKAKSILYKQLDEQILNDGCHFELSPMYHQIILFRVLELIDWFSKINDDDKFLRFLNEKALKMCSFLKTITFGNGDIPHFNDSTNHIALTSSQLLHYAETLGITKYSSIELDGSGYRNYSFPNYKCIVDVGLVGPSYQPGHSHADALSFVLYVKDKPTLVDVGTSTYQIGKRRNFERSTAAHNTVVVGNRDQSQVWGGFRVAKRAKVIIKENTKSTLRASHDGYFSTFKVHHNRIFTFLNDGILLVDEIGNESGEANFHFHPDCKVELINGKVILSDLNLTVNFDSATAVRIEEYNYAIGFNAYKVANKVVVNFKKQLTSQIKF